MLLLSDEIRARYAADVGRHYAVGFAALYAPEHPCHIESKIAHGSDALFVFHHVLGTGSVHLVPIGGRHDGHLTYREIFVQLVNAYHRSRAACGCDRGGGLMGIAAVSVKHAVEKRFERAVGRCVIYGRTHDKPVRFFRFGDQVVHDIVFEHAAFSPALAAISACHAAGYTVFSELNDLAVYALFRKRSGDDAERRVSAAVGMRTAVDHKNFHCRTLLFRYIIHPSAA